MDFTKLPTSVEIAGKECEFNSDFRDILEVFKAINDPDLLPAEKSIVSLNLFYKTDDCLADVQEALKQMDNFICMSEVNDKSNSGGSQKRLYDWEKDFNIIIAPINKILGYDVRGKEYVHWWTFLSAFMEIGECTFSTYVGIRDKLNKSKKLEKYEERILRENKDKVLLKKKVDDTTQALMNEIMGV